MQLAAATHENEIFAANRARGTVRLAVQTRLDGTTHRQRVHESGSLRVRFPSAATGEMEAVLVNTAGGIAGGDAYQVNIALGERSRLLVTSAAAEKIYGTTGPSASIDVRIKVSAGGCLAWMPQETILFDNCGLSRSIAVDLAETAHLLLAEAIVFGRHGKGEIVANGTLHERWRVRRAGRLIYADGMALNGPIARRLGEPAIGNGGLAVATLLLTPGDDTATEKIRALTGSLQGEVGVSAWNGILLMRFCARDGAALRNDLALVLVALRSAPLPRLWMN
jgi:urease accessory protein